MNSFLYLSNFYFKSLYLSYIFLNRPSSSTLSVMALKLGSEVSLSNFSSRLRFSSRISFNYYLLTSKVCILVSSLLISASLNLFLYFSISNNFVTFLSCSSSSAELVLLDGPWNDFSSWSFFFSLSFPSCYNRCFCLLRFWISSSATMSFCL